MENQVRTIPTRKFIWILSQWAVTLTMDLEDQLTPIRITDGAFDMWLPAGNVLNSGTGFLNPVEETTLTIPLQRRSDHCRGIRCEI